MSDVEMDSDSESGQEEEINNSDERQDWVTGKIYMIHLENFLTHSEATVFPSAELNILIGPNGTGKSSIVAAIIIGMGGSTKILSEHNKLSDYVKNGTDRSKVTVTIYRDSHGNRARFCREFGRDNKSTFTIDGRKCTEKHYLEEVNALNIQVGNLCQFLPQERVQDFAKQNPQELFLSTQKSVCSDELIEKFEELKQLRNVHLNGDKKLQHAQNMLIDSERRVELLQGLVDDIRRQDALVARKEMIEKKLAWMTFEEAYIKYKEIDNDLKLAKQALDETEKKKKALATNSANVVKKRATYEKQLTDASNKKKNCQKEINKILEQNESLVDGLKREEAELEAMKEAAREKHQKIAESRTVLSVYQKDCDDHLNQIGSVDEINQQMQQIDEKVKKLRDGMQKLSAARTKLNAHINSVIQPAIRNIDDKIKGMESVEMAKLEFLRKMSPDCYNAVVWLRENQNQFQSKIYEPMILELNVRGEDYGRYIENVVSIRDFLAFTCENVDDMNKFMTILRKDKKLEINAVHSDASNEIRFKSQTPISDMRKLGGEIYMIDCLEAPIPILNYLCQVYKFHNILIGNNNLERKADHLPNGIQLFFTPTHRVAVKVSRYTNQKSLMSSLFKGKNFLNVRVSAKELEELKQERAIRVSESDATRNKRNECEVQMNNLNQICTDKFKEKADLQKQINQYEDLKRKIKQQENKVNRMEQDTVDIGVETEKFEQNAQKIIKNILKLRKNVVVAYEKLSQCDQDELSAKLCFNIFKSSTTNMDVEIMECNEEYDRRKAYFQRITELLNKHKKECKEKQVTAKKLTNNHQPSDGDKFPFKQQFDELPKERVELEEEIEDIENQINCRSADDQRVLDEYNEKLESIERLKNEITKINESAGSLEREMNEIHRHWYAKVQEMVTSINNNFSNFMASMSCAGEVEITHPTEYDYEQYGIEIRVKYRNNANLSKLDRFVQSGGERAVAIAVYSLSLQHLSQVPFRCVDEINQGMDPNNERRIFEMLVNNVGRPGQSQFFYVTPKLQTNLPYNDYVTCLTVWNGPFTESNDYFIN